MHAPVELPAQLRHRPVTLECRAAPKRSQAEPPSGHTPGLATPPHTLLAPCWHGPTVPLRHCGHTAPRVKLDDDGDGDDESDADGARDVDGGTDLVAVTDGDGSVDEGTDFEAVTDADCSELVGVADAATVTAGVMDRVAVHGDGTGDGDAQQLP